MKIIVFILGHIIFCSYAVADILKVEYSSFYGHVKKLDDPDTEALRFAFGFQHIAEQRLCRITSARIITQKLTQPLIIEQNYRFTVPTDKILKMAKAMVVIELDDQANRCDMSVQLETLPSYLKSQYTSDELLFLFNQYQAFFDNMGSFLSFMMPSATGLLLHFDTDVDFPKALHSLLDNNDKIKLSQTWLMQQTGLALPQKPLRITAIIEK